MGKKKFKIQPKVWPKEYTFEEFQRLNPNTSENVLVNYYNKYSQEYAKNYSRHIKHFENNKKVLIDNLQEVKDRYDDSQHFLKMYYGGNDPTAAGAGSYPIFTPLDPGNLINWHDATEGITLKGGTGLTKDEISRWKNKAGTNDLIDGVGHGGVGSTEPELTPEGDAVDFNSSNNAFNFEEDISLGAFTAWFVVSLDIDGTNKFHGLFKGNDGVEGMWLFGNSSGLFFDMELNDGTDSDSMSIGPLTNDPQNGVKTTIIVTKDAPENATVKVYINNAESFSNGELDKNIAFTPVLLGIFNGNNRHLNGDLFEWGLYDKALNDSDRKQLYYYLGIKHNIQGYDGPSELKPYNWPDSGYL